MNLTTKIIGIAALAASLGRTYVIRAESGSQREEGQDWGDEDVDEASHSAAVAGPFEAGRHHR